MRMGCVTGKPVTQGGVRGRKEATGLGVFYGVREVCNMPDVMEKLGLTTGVEGKSVVVQGLEMLVIILQNFSVSMALK